MRKTEKVLSIRLAGWSVAALTTLSILLHPIVTAAQYNTPNTNLVTHDDCEIISKVMTTQRVNALSMASFGAAYDWAKLGWSVPATTATADWRVLPHASIFGGSQARQGILFKFLQWCGWHVWITSIRLQL